MVAERQYNSRLIAIIITVAVSLFSAECRAQTFSNLYYDNRPAMLFSGIEATDSLLYVTGVTNKKQPPYHRKALVGKLQLSGTLDSVIDVVDSNSLSYEIFTNSLKRTKDGLFIASGSMSDSVSKVLVIRFDGTGTIQMQKEFADPQIDIYQGLDIVETVDSGYLIAVNANYINTNSEVIVIKIDRDGNLQNKQVYGKGSEEWPWVIRPMLNGNYMIGAFSMKANTNTPFWCKTWLIEVDSMGNMVNQWLDSDPKNLWPRGMQQTADSGWIIVRQHLAYDVSNAQGYNGSLVKLDKNFNKEWEVVRGDNNFDAGFYDVEILPDGKYILCGTTPTWGHDSAYQWGWILKVDTGGTILWDKKYVAYERFGTYNYLYDIDVLPNGDLLACGELQFTHNVGISPIQQGWILRTDSNGCVLENCMVGIDPQPATGGGFNSQIQVYPNPASDIVQLEVSSEMIGGEVKVYDVSGRMVKEWRVASEKWQVDVSDLGKGVYVIIAENEGRVERSKLVVE